MDPTSKDIRLGEDEGIVLIDGLEDCFMTPIQALKHFDRLFNTTPLDVNLDGDAYASDDEDDVHPQHAIDFGCIAWE